MKLNKSLLSCAVAIAMGTSFSTFADTATKSGSVSDLSTKVSVQSTSNSMVLAQTQVGNTALLLQDGDGNAMQVTTIGNDNTTEVSQFQTGNYVEVTTVGDNNVQIYSQDGLYNGALTTVTGNNNQLYVSQEGEGLFFNNEAINSIVGDDNIVDIE